MVNSLGRISIQQIYIKQKALITVKITTYHEKKSNILQNVDAMTENLLIFPTIAQENVKSGTIPPIYCSHCPAVTILLSDACVVSCGMYHQRSVPRVAPLSECPALSADRLV